MGKRENPNGAIVLALGWMLAVMQLLPLPIGMALEKKQTDVGKTEKHTASAASGEGDFDATPDGKKRLKEIEDLGGKLSKERDAVERERRPFALRRDAMLVEVAQARQRLPRTHNAAAMTEQQIAILESQLRFAPGSLGKELKSQQSRFKSNLSTLTRQIKSDRTLIDDRMTQIHALNVQVAAIEQRIQRLNEQAEECRKQWLAIRQPFKKYSRCDFEGLRQVLDDWLVLDAHWPQAYAWAALCSYELGDTAAASVYLEKAQRVQADQFGKRAAPQLEALAGLILRNQAGQAAKSRTAIANANRLADKHSDWQTHFLLGRCYFEQTDDAVRARTHFQRALAIEPDCDCAKLWLARLQTTSSLDEVRDVYTGIAQLEQLWNKCGHRSWRLAGCLADAYSAAKRDKDAEALRSLAAELRRDR